MALNLLYWLGRNARFVMALGCIAALFVPQLSAFVRPALPALVSMVLGLAMARLDLAEIARTTLKPKRLGLSIGLTLLLMPVMVALYAGLGRLTGLNLSDQTSLILLAASPPIASATGICFLLGYNARLALETTLVATILTPILGPLIVAFVLPDMAPISALLLAQRLSLMIAGGLALGLTIRTVIGAARIERNKLAFDGISALGMILFVIPLFDGVGATLFADPSRAFWVLALAFIFNLGINLVTAWTTGRYTTAQTAGTLGILSGNRTVAIYLAALPYDPQFALFVALYQFPMYLTPLLLNLKGRPA